MKLQEEMRMKDQRNKLAMDRLKRQLEEANKKNESLQNEIKIYEEMRINKNNSSNKLSEKIKNINNKNNKGLNQTK